MDLSFDFGSHMQNCQVIRLLGFCFDVLTWKAKCPFFKAIVAGFRGKVA